MTWSDWRTVTAAGDAVALLGLGTNLGDRIANLHMALEGLAGLGVVDGVSAVYESEPFGMANQPLFLNMAVRLRTALSPAGLLRAAKELEVRIGRTPGERMGPRVIDIDILMYGDLNIDQPGLRVPHPGIMDRSFVLAPLLDLEPGLRHPATGASLRERLDNGSLTSVTNLGPAAVVLDRARTELPDVD